VPISTKGVPVLLASGAALIVGRQDTGDSIHPPIVPEAVTYDAASNTINPASTPPLNTARVGVLPDGRVAYTSPGAIQLYTPPLVVLPAPVVTSVSVREQNTVTGPPFRLMVITCFQSLRFNAVLCHWQKFMQDHTACLRLHRLQSCKLVHL
jgi:hypothetical protein